MGVPLAQAVARASLVLATLALAARPAPAATLAGVAPGKSTRAEMHQRLGQPVQGKGSAAETFRGRDAAFAEIVLSYGRGDVVRRAGFHLAKPLGLAEAERLAGTTAAPRPELGHPFDKAATGGNTIHYDADRVHFFVQDGQVTQIWLDSPEPPPAPEPPAPQPEAVHTAPATKAQPIAPSSAGMMPTFPLPPRPAAPEAAPPTPAAEQPTVQPAPRPEPAADPLAAVRAARPAREGEPPSFRGLAVGRATRDEVQALLGPPRFVSLAGAGGDVCEYDGTRLGLHAVVVQYGPDAVVRHIDLRLAKPVPPDDVLEALGLGKPDRIVRIGGASVACFEAQGVEVSLLAQSATGLRLGGQAEAKPAATPPVSPPLVKLPKAPPEVTEPPAAAPPEEPAPPPAPAKRLEIRRVWHEHGAQLGGFAGMMVLAEIAVAGLKGEPIVVTARLRSPDGEPVKAAAESPTRFADDQGRLAAVASDTVRYDPSVWNPYRVFVPYSLIDLPRGADHRLTLSVTATCGGISRTAETPCIVRLP